MNARRSISSLLLSALLASGMAACGGNPVDTESNTMITDPSVEVAAQTIAPSGGTIIIDGPGDTLDGLEIDIPTGAYAEPKSFRVSYAPIRRHEFGEHCNPITPLITIENGGGYADELMTVTIPIDIPDDEFAMAFLYDNVTGELEAMPVLESTSEYVTVFTANFAHSDVAAIAKRTTLRNTTAGPSRSRLFVSSIRKSILDGDNGSSFRPGVDDWQFPNYGSHAAPDGHCAGQSIAALWYYAEKRSNGHLFGRYDNDGQRTTPKLWQDDASGYKFCSVLQNDMQWNSLSRKLRSLVRNVTPDIVTYYATSYTFLLLHDPQFIAITNDTAGHAIIGYSMAGNAVQVADPNYPGDASRAIPYANGNFGTYYSGDNALKTGVPYTGIYFIGVSSIIDWKAVATRWGEVASGAIGAGAFPTYTLKAMNDNGEFVPLTDGFSIKNGTLNFSIESTTSLKIDSVFSESQSAIPIDNEAVHLSQGKQLIGFYITDLKRQWVAFRWVSVTVGSSSTTPSCSVQLSVNGFPVTIDHTNNLSSVGDNEVWLQIYTLDPRAELNILIKECKGPGTYSLKSLGGSYASWISNESTSSFFYETDEEHTATAAITQFDEHNYAGSISGDMFSRSNSKVAAFNVGFHCTK